MKVIQIIFTWFLNRNLVVSNKTVSDTVLLLCFRRELEAGRRNVVLYERIVFFAIHYAEGMPVPVAARSKA